MCQLLGMSFSQEIQPVTQFRTLISRSLLHPDGWGLAYYPSNSKDPALFKEPIPGCDSQLAYFLCTYSKLKAKTIIGHIRKATRGVLIQDNTHPFTRCYAGKVFTFAHNGTLPMRRALTGLSYQPIGKTDSEKAFCYLLTQLSRHQIKPVGQGNLEGYSDIYFQVIHEILLDINVKTVGTFNCIFSDGTYLFCYRDIEKKRKLYFLKSKIETADSSRKCDGETEDTPQRRSLKAKGYTVATEPMSDGDWKPFSAGHLMVFKDGEIQADLS